jgi:hypothetical protein
LAALSNSGHAIPHNLVLQKDICLLYHSLVDAGSIHGEGFQGSVYTQPYWQFVSVSPEDPDNRFVRDGCLLLLLAMALELIDGSGYFIVDKLKDCQDAVAGARSEDPDTVRLVELVHVALRLCQEKAELLRRQETEDTTYSKGLGSPVVLRLREPREFRRELGWAWKRYVLGYFSQAYQAATHACTHREE